MKNKIIVCLCFLLAATALIAAGSPPTPPQEDLPTAPTAPMSTYTNIPYGTHPLQTMDIYTPGGPTDARYPVVLTLHGGEWLFGDKESSSYYTSTILAADCIHVNINYRLLGNGISENAAAPYEEILDDIEAALDFLMAQAELYQVDTSKAGIAGFSSGGHLALLYGYTRTEASIPIRLVISESGPTNFMDDKTFTQDGDLWLHPSHNGHDSIQVTPIMPKNYRIYLIGAITGTEYGEPGWEEAWKKASPAHVVTADSPKTYLFHGSHDGVVPMSHPELLAGKHPDCTLYELYGATHNIYENPAEWENIQAIFLHILEEF